jgi:signal transduction histidine kinase/CheY-like chemotaxis protein
VEVATDPEAKDTKPSIPGGKRRESVTRLRERVAELEQEVDELRLFVRESQHDAEELAELEEQRQQARKMEAVGQLARGIAHDLNNVLGAIMTFASLLREDALPDDPRCKDIDDIIEATKRGRDLTQNLLGFAGRGEQRKELVSLNDIVLEVRELLARQLSDRLSFKLYLHDDLPAVEGDREQLTRVVANVCINAVEATGGRGEIAIDTHSVDLGRRALRAWADLRPGTYAVVEVIDRGPGMEREVLDRAFEPFFTTKEQDQGAGLGLAMAYGAIRNHGGTVTIDSYLGTGTKVTILLPTVSRRAARFAASGPLQTIGAQVQGALLVVDDEALIRRSIRRALTRLGYEVLLASNGVEAIDVVRERRDDIALVLLDLKMPVMDGETAFVELKSSAPDLPVLIISALADEGKAQELLDAGAAGFVQKPFSMRSISQAVASALSGKA